MSDSAVGEHANSDVPEIRVVGTFDFLGGAHGLQDPTLRASLDVRLPPTYDVAAIDRLKDTANKAMKAAQHLPPVHILGQVPLSDHQPALVAAQWLATISLWLQAVAGQPVSSACVLRSPKSGLIIVAVPYLHRDCAIGAIETSAALVTELIERDRAGSLNETVASVISTASRNFMRRNGKLRLPLTLLRFIESARHLDIPYLNLSGNLFQFGYGAVARQFDGNTFSSSSMVGEGAARARWKRVEMLAKAGCPVPDLVVARSVEKAVSLAGDANYDVVVRTLRDDGRDEGWSLFRTADDLAHRFRQSSGPSGSMTIEKRIPGHGYRSLVVAGQLLYTVQGRSCGLFANGHSTIKELVSRESEALTARGQSPINLGTEARLLLERQGLTPDSIVEATRFVSLANGAVFDETAVAVDVTSSVHPENRFLVERAARLFGAEIAVVDVVSPDISRSWRDLCAAVVGLRHGLDAFRYQPGLQDPRQFVEIVRRGFADSDGRIPIAAVTGTNGKSTVCQMLHQILLASGLKSGVATTQGVWIGDQPVATKTIDKAGYPGGLMLLMDPCVQAAVIEMPRKGLLNMGFPFDRCSVSALLNVQEDHIGEDGVETLDQMAAIKASVLERARDAVVINADDDRCLEMRQRAVARKHILVSTSADNPVVVQHVTTGGVAIISKGQHDEAIIGILDQGGFHELMRATDIPATEGGLIYTNILNAMSAIALAVGLGVDESSIRGGLGQFRNSFDLNPGRLSPVPGYPCKVLIDFAHNVEAMQLLCDYVQRAPCKGKKYLVNYNGGRFRKFISAWAKAVAPAFDRFVIGLDPKSYELSDDYEGVSFEDACQEYADFILDNGVGRDQLRVCPDMQTGIATALGEATQDDLVMMVGEPYDLWPILTDRSDMTAKQTAAG